MDRGGSRAHAGRWSSVVWLAYQNNGTRVMTALCRWITGIRIKEEEVLFRQIKRLAHEQLGVSLSQMKVSWELKQGLYPPALTVPQYKVWGREKTKLFYFSRCDKYRCGYLWNCGMNSEIWATPSNPSELYSSKNKWTELRYIKNSPYWKHPHSLIDCLAYMLETLSPICLSRLLIPSGIATTPSFPLECNKWLKA